MCTLRMKLCLKRRVGVIKNREAGGIAINIVLVGIAVFLVAVFIYGAVNKPPNAHLGNGEAWNKNMVMGSAESPNTFIQYTDYFCSFCSEVHEATSDPRFEENFIKTGKVRYENRVITVLKQVSPNTEQGANAALCAADQGKYWQYSLSLVPRIKSDYFDKGIGVKNVASPVPIEKLPLSYFTTSAQAVGIDLSIFESCMKNETHMEEINRQTTEAIKLGVTGLPYMVVNDYKSSGGFMGGYEGLTTVLKAGGVQEP